MAKSKLLIPGARSMGSTRASVPYPHCGGGAKQLTLNHCATEPPPAFLSHPATTSGRMLLTPKPAFSKDVALPEYEIFSGKPFWNVVIPSTPHPPTILSATGDKFEANIL